MARMALWFFQRVAPGEIRRIPLPSMQRFLVGERPLEQDGDGFVRCIGLSLELCNRKPASVARVWFSKIRVRDDGTIDPHHRPAVMKLAAQAGDKVEASAQPGPATGAVITAAHRFAQRRLSNLAEWRPEEADMEALRLVVNGRAGKQML